MPAAPASQASAATHSARSPAATRASATRIGSFCFPRIPSASRFLFALAILLGVASSGCYYGHLASGQLRLLLARDATEGVQSDPETPPRIREQLALVEEARLFARELGLDVGGRYTSYVDWPGDRVMTTVVATRPGEIEAAEFDFPIIGRAPYKGFFELDRAEKLAGELRSKGHDVCLVPVAAYSTLGWFDDPITTPMLSRGNLALVETIIHEFVHATVFVESEPEFNEGVARFIGQEASVRFFGSRPDEVREDGKASSFREAAARIRVEESRIIDRALLTFRVRVGELYARNLDVEERNSRRQELEDAARAQLAALPLTRSDPATLAERAHLGDACLALRGTYNDDTERYALVLQGLGNDLATFIARLEQAAAQEDPRAAFFHNLENAGQQGPNGDPKDTP